MRHLFSLFLVFLLAGVSLAQDLSSFTREQINEELKLREALHLKKVADRYPGELKQSQNPYLKKSFAELQGLVDNSELASFDTLDLLGSLKTMGVIGDDDRQDVAKLSPQTAQEKAFIEKVKAQSQSVCLVIRSETPPEEVASKGLSLARGDRLGLCHTERFHEQPSRGEGTGFVAGPQTIATAGHCIPNELNNLYFVFDFKLESDGTVPLEFAPSQVFRAKRLIKRVVDRFGADFAFIIVDRPIGRPALSFSEKVVEKRQELYMLGHPSGLPLKFTTGKALKSKSDSYFRTSLDAFSGNSGSPVFDRETLQVVGILVRGDKDYTHYAVGNCRKVIRYGTGPIKGEDVTRTQAFSRYLERLK